MRLTGAPTSANRAEPTEQNSLQRCSRPANAWKQPAVPGWPWRPRCDRSGVRSDVTRSRQHCRRFVDTDPAVLDEHLRRCSPSWLGKGLSKPGRASSETLSHSSARPVSGFLTLLGPAVTLTHWKNSPPETHSLSTIRARCRTVRVSHHAQVTANHQENTRRNNSGRNCQHPVQPAQSPRDDRAARGPRHTPLFFAHTLDNPLLKLKYHILITQCSHISELAPLRDVPQQSTHDLS